jgi:hypothetical protein
MSCVYESNITVRESGTSGERAVNRWIADEVERQERVDFIKGKFVACLARYISDKLQSAVQTKCWGCIHDLGSQSDHDVCLESMADQIDTCYGEVVANLREHACLCNNFYTEFKRDICCLVPSPNVDEYTEYNTDAYLEQLSKDTVIRDSVKTILCGDDLTDCESSVFF